jgi:hypothetical protein
VSPIDRSRLLPWLAYAAMALFYLCAVWLDQPPNSFSPDSWTYQELARSLGGNAPYQPVLLRSFWSLEHSAAFPPGYPLLLHLLHMVFGSSPYVAVWSCVFLALLTPLIAARLARTLGVATEAGLLAGVALLGFAGYFEEVISGRSVPLAVAAVLGGLILLLEARTVWRAMAGGALLGFACLVRFDQVPLMLLILGYAWWRGIRPREIAVAALAALAAMSPWMVMSWQYFGSLWASDNSWVALSSTPANVHHFPAASPGTMFSDPLGFAGKCLVNVVRLGYHGLRSGIPAAPHVVALLVLWAWHAWRERGDSALRRHAGLLIISFAALAPQVLTGYAATRYLCLQLLLVSLLCLGDLFSTPRRPVRVDYRLLGVVAVSLVLVLDGLWVAHAVRRWDTTIAAQRFEQDLMSSLKRCQDAEPQVRYVFPPYHLTLGGRYAAQLGGRSSMTPHGFEQLDAAKRREFEIAVGPLRYVRPVPADGTVHACDELLSERRE